MAESSIFEWLSGELERRTELSRIEARGTIRLVLKDAGLDPSIVRALQIAVVLERLMPAALKKRGVEAADQVCRELADAARARSQQTQDSTADSPHDVFERLEAPSQRRPKS